MNIKKIIKKMLKENYRIIIFFISLLLILEYPVPYYISTGGGITNLDKRIHIENATKQKGSYNLSYVSQVDGNLITYLFSYIIPSWDREKVNDYKISDNETIEDIEQRGKLSLNTTNEIATMVAYKTAGKEINIKKTHYYIAYLLEPSIKKIKIGDELISINDIDIKDFEKIKEEISNQEEVTIKVLRNKKEINETVEVKEKDGSKEVGISFIETYDYEVNPKIKFSFTGDESGGSAGLMTTLSIFDLLEEEDYTHGYTIAGTGTINPDGSVGEISGVKYKLKGAVKGKANIFFAPAGDNYKEALELKKKNKYKIESVEVNTFEDAVNYLKKINT